MYVITHQLERRSSCLMTACNRFDHVLIPARSLSNEILLKFRTMASLSKSKLRFIEVLTLVLRMLYLKCNVYINHGHTSGPRNFSVFRFVLSPWTGTGTGKTGKSRSFGLKCKLFQFKSLQTVYICNTFCDITEFTHTDNNNNNIHTHITHTSFFEMEILNMMRSSRLVCVFSFSRERKKNVHSPIRHHCNDNTINNAYAFATNIFYNISHLIC